MAELDAVCSQRFLPPPALDPDLVYFLGDNVEFAITWSAVSGKVPCFRNNRGLYWIPSLRRWIVTREKLCVAGLPVHEPYAASMGVNVLPVRDLHRASSLLANSMHFATSTIVQFVALVCFAKREF